MEFILKLNIPEAKKKINFSDNIIFLGSCFSDEISLHAKQHGLNVLANPFGTLFHPLSIAKNILNAIHASTKVDLVQNNDVFFDYLCSGKVFGMSKTDLINKVIAKRNQLKNELLNASHLFITFGSAFAYHLNETDQIVGNCHKQPQNTFTKQLTSIEQIEQVWKGVIGEIKQINPNIQICFTVSPVRHAKDGIHENNLSKSTLFLAIHKLMSEMEVNYFPAFEIVNDELRDYRFFKEDLVHPNQQAIQFVWEKFMESYFSSNIIDIAKKVKEIKVSMQHRVQYPESKSALQFKEQLAERKKLLSQAHTEICWE